MKKARLTLYNVLKGLHRAHSKKREEVREAIDIRDNLVGKDAAAQKMDEERVHFLLEEGKRIHAEMRGVLIGYDAIVGFEDLYTAENFLELEEEEKELLLQDESKLWGYFMELQEEE